MTRYRRCDDGGQAFPIYITVVGGLLLLAFAYFAVGQAGANRNGAQTAADAAALAAAQDLRDQLADKWVADMLTPAKWQDIFDGRATELEPSCRRADQLAARNDARVLGCTPEGLLGFRVEVQTNRPVGDSIVDGTEDWKSVAEATAVVEPRCTFEVPAEGNRDTLPPLTCEHRVWDLDPEQLDDIPEAHDLFDVHLAD
ncbi:pilus assembly protein TadG-related protein [Streptomyces sp. HMX87]|uniref:pilus assembly protein TadG-related protein n=1 Tax=Streptomyces sp. HMX87 TaxID=3390849 RepID=UPI003A859D27